MDTTAAMCGELPVPAFTSIIKDALYLALPPSLHIALDVAETPEDVFDLVSSFGPDEHFVFVFPDWDRLFRCSDGDGDERAEQRATVRGYVERLTSNHYGVFSVTQSGRCARALEAYGPDAVDVVNLVGGMSHVRMSRSFFINLLTIITNSL